MIFTTPRARPVAWPKSAGTRVLIYDRSDLMRAALAQFVGGQPDLLICGTAATPEGALRHALRLEPDVVVLGLSFERPGALLHLIGDIRSVPPRAVGQSTQFSAEPGTVNTSIPCSKVCMISKS